MGCPPLLVCALEFKAASSVEVFGKQFLITQENKDLDIVQATRGDAPRRRIILCYR
jgi:hypothetical protein